MRPITITIYCALAVAALAAPASAAAADYYLKFGAVKSDLGGAGGAAADAGKGRENRIEVLSSEFGSARKGWDGSVKGGSARDAGSATPAAERQLGWVKLSQPLAQGNLRIKVKFPWLGCRVGAAYDNAVAVDSAGRFELTDVTIASCERDAIELTYAKVTVRGWNPTTKQH